MKISNKKKIISLSVATALAISLNAEDNPTKLNDVTVVNTAFDAQVKSITSEELEEEQASSVQDILRKLPSVEVGGNARYGQMIHIRGLEDSFANVTIDGAKMTGQLFHHSSDQTIDASLLKVSEVELGPNSALSGPGVVNGSFAYETKDPSDFLRDDESFGGQITAGTESANERKKTNAALFGKVSEKIELVGMYSKSDDGVLHLSDGSTEANKESELESILGKVVIKPSDASTIKVSYNSYEDAGNRSIVGNKTGSETTTDDYSSISRDTLSLKYDYNPSSQLIDLETEVYTNEQELLRTKSSDGSTSKYINSSTGFDFRNTSVIDEHKITYGTDFNHEEQETDVSGTLTDGGEIDARGLYGQAEFAIDKLFLTLGARYDKHELGGIYGGDFSQLSPKMKLKYLSTENLTLRAGFGRIFKGPALGETYFVDSTDTQVSDVEPQTGRNVEAGFDYDFSNSLDADEAILGFTAYTYNLDAYAESTRNNDLDSSGDVEVYGFETMVSYQKDKLSLNASHTYTDVERTDEDGHKYDDSASNIHVFKAGTKYKISNELKVGYNFEFVPSNDYYSYSSRSDSYSTNKRLTYSVHYINATYKPASIKDLSIFFGIDNLFDKAYIRHTSLGSSTTSSNGTYELERNYKLSATYRF